MVALATAFKACQRASASWGQLVIPAQLALLLVWAPTRLLFLALLSVAKSAHRTDTHLRDRGAAGASAQAGDPRRRNDAAHLRRGC